MNTLTHFPVKDVAAKLPAAVKALLGKPSAIELVRPSSTPCKEQACEKMIYQGGKYEIVFINGVADWITISQVAAYTTPNAVLEYLGLPEQVPAFNNPQQVVWWRDIAGLHEVNFFYDIAGRPAYIYVKCITK
ncbi:hypothetical protein FNT36_20765 [Hymenobacter setariae]|uniref:Uncharacterized protein n=1 Tax=Hymenobacter setariae TaxID=2594794 RepID=A0A558BQ06_9BACT|nr:hypothetical protein [Hymenobacter setariae]TVT38614.1 hypothetical protein FNT36_20765 [Hymenobacter setariae]